MKISLINAKHIKAIKGFGASACWWSQQLKDEKAADYLAELFYGGSGLKMNIYRYNVGGGYEKDNLRTDNPWRTAQSFMNKDGSYDWSRDKYAVGFMKKALEKGNVDTLIFFVNSPHFTHTLTGQTSGGFTEYFSNLARDKYSAFAKYIVDIAHHFIEEGYPVKYISPVNEPQWKWGGSRVWQEGCHYEVEEVKACFHAVANELEKRNSALMLYGPESGNISDTTKQYYNVLSSDPLIMKYLGCFCYHSYGSDDDLQSKIDFGKWAKSNIKTSRFDMSEWCELPCRSDTKSIDGALITARVIGEDLIYTGVDSWSAWVCVNQWERAEHNGKCYSDAFVTARDDFSEYYISMRYYAMAHFSKFIPVGSISLDINYSESRGLSVFAFKLTDSGYALVCVNNSNMKRVIETDIDTSSIKMIISNQEKQLCEAETGDKIIITPKSIATVIIK